MHKHTKPKKLLNMNFMLLWQGQFMTLIGNSAFNIAMIFWLKHKTGSASLMGLLMMASMIPNIILSPITGVLADRYSRWRIMIFSDLIRGIMIISFAVLVFITPDASNMTITALFGLSIISGIIGSAFNPAAQASIPRLVPPEKLAAANSIVMFSQQITNTLGQGIGGVLFRILGAPVMFLINGIAFIYSSATMLFVKIPQEFIKRDEAKNKLYEIFQDFKEGIKFIWNYKGMLYMLIGSSIIMLFIVPLIVLFPFYIEDYLHATSDWYGYIMAGMSVGTMIGYVMGAVKIPAHVRGNLMIIFFIIILALWGGFGFVTDKLFALVLMLLFGLFMGFINVNAMTIIQSATPDRIRGRVLSVMTTINTGLMPIGMGFAGIVADLLDKNIPLMFILSSSICLVVLIVFVFNKQYRKFLAYEIPKVNIHKMEEN